MHLKKLREQRAQLQEKMKKLFEQAEAEERAMNEDEVQKFGDYEKQIKAIDDTIQMEERARALMTEEEPTKGSDKAGQEDSAEERALAEERAFEDYIRGVVSEQRADVTMNLSDNGAVIPTTIANRIISKVKEICPIFNDAEHYTVKGNLTLPYYDETNGSITMAYATEGEDGESTSGSFGNIELKGYLGRAITEVSKSLINNSQFPIVSFVIDKMAEAISLFLEHELLIGTKGKIEGLSTLKNVLTAKSATSVTADELIDIQESIPDRYQGKAYWIMSKNTRTAIRKLKDGQGNYLLNKDASARWNYTLLGKDVYVSDAMPDMAAGKRAIVYGDMTGLAVKVSEEINIEVLRETKARKHMLEVLGFVEADAKVQDEQKLVAMNMKASTTTS